MMYADNMDLSSESPEGLQNIYLIHFMNTVRTGNNQSMLFRANTTCIMNRQIFKIPATTGIPRQKMYFKLVKTMKNLYFNHVTRSPLFDTYVGSVLRYASEVWEFHKGGAFCKIHLGYWNKIMLKVRKNNSFFMVYNE